MNKMHILTAPGYSVPACGEQCWERALNSDGFDETIAAFPNYKLPKNLCKKCIKKLWPGRPQRY